MSAEQGLSVGADIRDQGLEKKDDRYASEQENEDQEANEFPRCDHGRDVSRDKLFPRYDSAKVDEHG